MEEKNLPYDSVLIQLRSKPHWYKDIVPTELTPAAVINGDLVYESLDILKVRTALSAVCLSHTTLWHCCRSAWESSATDGLHSSGANAFSTIAKLVLGVGLNGRYQAPLLLLDLNVYTA